MLLPRIMKEPVSGNIDGTRRWEIGASCDVDGGSGRDVYPAIGVEDFL